MEKKSMGSGKPSKRQAEILQFVTKFQREKDYSPSLGEIAKNFGVSIPTIHQHISYLRKKNLLSADKGKRRSIQAIRNPEPIEVTRSMLSRGANYYALKVAGTSMIEEGISDGDVVIVREQQTVDDGEKAVAYLPDRNAVTLKKIYREKKRIRLVPANKYMKPFYETNVEIQGKVVGVLRKEI